MLSASFDFVVRIRSQEFVVMKFEVFEGEARGGIWCGNIYLSIFARENSLAICHQNFTKFFTLKFAISKETSQPSALTLGAGSNLT